uniref:THAP-type domain-containing protein n=1 Tax=Anopheles funestus TaxID=62324 RepID=A0A182R3S1_ANOFN
MPAPCAVSLCRNNRRNAKKHSLEISFHIFPKYDPIRKAWVQFCNREENWEPSKNDVMKRNISWRSVWKTTSSQRSITISNDVSDTAQSTNTNLHKENYNLREVTNHIESCSI